MLVIQHITYQQKDTLYLDKNIYLLCLFSFYDTYWYAGQSVVEISLTTPNLTIKYLDYGIQFRSIVFFFLSPREMCYFCAQFNPLMNGLFVYFVSVGVLSQHITPTLRVNWVCLLSVKFIGFSKLLKQQNNFYLLICNLFINSVFSYMTQT